MEGGIPITAEDTNGIVAASFKPSRKTKFYIHGFLSDGYEPYVSVSLDYMYYLTRLHVYLQNIKKLKYSLLMIFFSSLWWPDYWTLMILT